VTWKRTAKKQLKFGIMIALIVDAALWWSILAERGLINAVHFLDVGQGDSQLIELANGVQILTDAGPSRNIMAALPKIADNGDRYIDIGIITHPQLDHFEGFLYALKNYRFGIFLYNGTEEVDSSEWKAFRQEAEKRGIAFVAVSAGDRIRSGELVSEILSPTSAFIASAEANHGSVVQKITIGGLTVLLTGDIDSRVEKVLIEQQRGTLGSDVLKVAHHGSKYSTSAELLDAVNPKVAIIQSGKDNGYGHPHPETIKRLEERGVSVMRNDRQGIVTLVEKEGKLEVYASKKASDGE
jgi:competence protein ComEC